jgi:hypothetical protein
MNRPHPLQNRVDPFGDLAATSARGTLMGNRGGRLHRADRTLATRRWASKRWIACLCAFGDRHRDVWGDSYTEFFFLDEPTALSAGHRPCFECRRAEAKAFERAFPGGGGADRMDAILHEERLKGTEKRTWRAGIATLPDATMIALKGQAFALRGGAMAPWSFSGYGVPERRIDGEADILTPPSIVAALIAGYRPRWAA